MVSAVAFFSDRQRTSTSGITSFACDQKSSTILFPVGGRLAICVFDPLGPVTPSLACKYGLTHACNRLALFLTAHVGMVCNAHVSLLLIWGNGLFSFSRIGCSHRTGHSSPNATEIMP